MEGQRRSDPTFPVFLLLAAVFFVFAYVTFPRRDAALPTSAAAKAGAAPPEIKLTLTSAKKRARSFLPIRTAALRLR
jgi:hypothetical protein